MMGERQLNQALELLKAQGFKYTKKREKMLTFFIHQDKYVSAKEVYDFMSTSFEGISYDTIYRNLNDFVELGLLEETELNGERKFRYHCGHHVGHHHHFICLTCGSTKEITICPMNDLGDELDGYEIEGHRFEIFGICPNCLKSDKKMTDTQKNS